MNDIEKRAREQLAAEFERFDLPSTAAGVREGTYDLNPSMRALVAALTPPEGYAQTLQDAARYRYIREIAAGEPSAFGRIEDAAFASHYGNPAQFDLNIDDQMASVLEVGRG